MPTHLFHINQTVKHVIFNALDAAQLFYFAVHRSILEDLGTTEGSVLYRPIWRDRWNSYLLRFHIMCVTVATMLLCRP